MHFQKIIQNGNCLYGAKSNWIYILFYKLFFNCLSNIESPINKYCLFI